MSSSNSSKSDSSSNSSKSDGSDSCRAEECRYETVNNSSSSSSKGPAVGTGSRSERDKEVGENHANENITAGLLHGGQQQVAVLRGVAAGVLSAAITSAFFFACSSKRTAGGVLIPKTRNFLIYNISSFSFGFLGGWIHTKAKLRAHERRLAQLREATIPNMNFMSMDSLAPPIPADSYTAAGEEAAAQLLQTEEQQRSSKQKKV